jgi:hypothetical protein
MPADSVTSLVLWLLVPAGLLAAVYVIGPLVVWSMARFRKDPTAIPFDPRQTPAPPEVQADLDRAVEALRPEGFEPMSYIVFPDSMPGTKTIAVLLIRREDDVLVLINVSINTFGGQAKVGDRSIEFVTTFADGFEHHTLWNLTSPPLPRMPSKSVLQVDSDDAGFLWRVHRAAVEAKRTSKNRPLPEDVVTPEYVKAEMLKSWTELAEVGWTRVDERRNEFRLTAKGAYLATWGMLWPVAGIRRAARRRRNARLFEEWGVTASA